MTRFGWHVGMMEEEQAQTFHDLPLYNLVVPIRL
jgi:hypothetical protein